MKHLTRSTLLFCILFQNAITTVAQSSELDSLKKQFDTYRTHTLQEKIYVSTDRPSYLTGETIWFKIYSTDASFHKPLGISRVAYVEILNNNNQPVLQSKITLTNGSGEGSLFLPATISSGNYVLRSYTNWMKNFSPDFYFSKPVSIVNPFVQLEQVIVPKASLDIQFFPEGGNLVAGFKSKIGFRVVNEAGNGINFSGVLLNQQHDTVTTFRPAKFGIGNFTFTPQPGESYTAIVIDEYGKSYEEKLPEALPDGYTLSVKDSAQEQIKVTVQAGVEDTGPADAAYLFVHSRNIISVAEGRNLDHNMATFLVDKKNLPPGISHFTVFTSAMNPVCERLYFKHPEQNLSIDISTDEQTYGTRRRVLIDLLTECNQTSRASNLNLSVYKTDSLPSPPGNMVSYFWLTSDLKGSIESSEYYMSNTPEAIQAADNLMLTHGWRRFIWQDVLRRKTPSLNFIPEYRGHIVNGLVTRDGAPAAGVMSYLAVPGKNIQLYASRSNGKGEVKYVMQNFRGSSRMITQTDSRKDSLHKVQILTPFSNNFGEQTLLPFSLLPNVANQLLQRSVAMQVQDVYYKERGERQHELMDSSTFYGKADEIYYLDAYTRFPVMEEVMREYVPGVYVRKRKDGFHFIVRDDVNKGVFDDSPLVLIDGVPIFDEDEMMAFSPLKIKRLDVVTKRYYLGPLNLQGIVSYSTYNGDLGGFQLNPRSITINYQGLQAQQEFFAPRYENQTQRQSRMPDQRYLLYWNPKVVTQKDGKTQLEFYSSDIPGEYRILVEGMTSDGQIGSTSMHFSVKRFDN